MNLRNGVFGPLSAVVAVFALAGCTAEPDKSDDGEARDDAARSEPVDTPASSPAERREPALQLRGFDTEDEDRWDDQG